jgi:hypothetical protein
MQETGGEVKPPRWKAGIASLLDECAKGRGRLSNAPYRHDGQVIQERGSSSECVQVIDTSGDQGLCG